MNSQLTGRRVLVVEDEFMVSWMLEYILTELGCEVVGPAARLREALAMIDAEVIDLAILDVNLNGEKSFPVADALIGRGVPFIFSTGYNADGILESYKDIPLLQKPYSQVHLSSTLERVLTANDRS